MIRIAWKLVDYYRWTGGANYFRNLAEALFALPDRIIDPVLIGNPANPPPPLNRCTFMPLPQRPRFWPAKIRERIDRKIMHNGGYFAASLLANDIRLLSHDQWLGLSSPVPALCWIPDFQHRRLPQFFSAKEIKSRNATFAAMAANAQAIVLSSEDARRDFICFYPQAAPKTYILPFVVSVPAAETLPAANALLERYGIAEPFFHLPNQLWVHKNHGLVVDALRILASRGLCPLVISTGLTEDYRNQGFFDSLSKRIAQAGLADRFRFLGLVPYPDMTGIMRRSLAVINPSLFEGWSTTVEEGKSMGKTLILSDLAVHREQAPERALYFDPRDPEALASHMLEVIEFFDPDLEKQELERASASLPGRIQQFALTYQNMVLDVIDRHRR